MVQKKRSMLDLSVHLITYNNEKHIAETLASIVRQNTSFEFEIVVGDDCSTDGTWTILNEFAAEHPEKFKLTQNPERLGILKNYKATLDRCSGNFVFDIAGDDLLKEDFALQKMVDALKGGPGIGFVDSGFDKIYDHTGKTIPFSNRSLLSSSKAEYKNQILLGRFTPTGICFNRDCLYRHVDFDAYLDMNLSIDDYPILVDLIFNSDFVLIPESLHYYRVHDQSFSHIQDFESIWAQKKQMYDLFGYFTKKYGFGNDLRTAFDEAYFKDVLQLAGYFENKEVGKDMYRKLSSKDLRDHIHYLASQNKLFRKLVSLI